jgi:hypothetical protein
MRTSARAICGLVVLLSPHFSRAQADDKKIIEIGWDGPSPIYIEQHIAEMEKLPFDGLVINLTENGLHDLQKRPDRQHAFAGRAFGNKALDPADFRESVDSLNKTRFTRFTDRFLRLNVTPGDFDWFDVNFDNIAANAKFLARIARQSGCKGIFLDTEAYGGQLFNYSKQKHAGEHSFAEYQKQVRARGGEFISAINSDFPDISLLITLGYAMPHGVADNAPMPENKYGLMPSFFDGMLDAATPGTIVYDGWEYSYNNRTAGQFAENRKTMLEKSLDWTANPPAYKQHVRASFGLWIDYDHKWNANDFTKNFFTPSEFAYSLHEALRHSDRYVWIWSESVSWWPTTVPPPYVEALREAKKPAMSAPATRPNPF